MEFIVLRTSLAYGCMGLCYEMLNLVVLGQILWFRFRCWFSVMKIGRGNHSLIKKTTTSILFTSPHRILGQSLSTNFTCKMWMENEILLYPNKKGLEGVIALTRTRPLIAQALNQRAGQEGHTSCRPGWTRLLAACNRLQTAPPAYWICACVGNTSFREPAGILEHKKWLKYN